MQRILLVSLLAAAALCPAARAGGGIDPELRRELDRLRPGHKTTAFVMMASQVDVHRLVARLDAMNATRAHRHRVVVESLQRLARGSRAELDALVERLGRDGEVEHVVDFWIFNGVALRGTRPAIERIAALTSVGGVYWAGSDEPGETDLIEPIALEAAPESSGPEPGLLECKADYVWNKGFRGGSVVVANVDTGVNGNHPTLSSRWRGNVPGVPPRAAWFDPWRNTTFPVDTRGHGTHTMGTICGDDGLGNHIGMANEALWIAANPIDTPVNRAQRNIWYNQAIQWTADPDGNPATVDDVPVVCGNSWGVRDPNNGVPQCATVFHASIDAAEAATCAHVFAAGNEGGRGPRVPADRVASDINTFTVGALNPGSTSIASFSSRGPSPCGNRAIKPEVSARGVNVRSVWINTYRSASGTSMATPHVAGGIALLRDVWSEITVGQVKRLLMRTADDLGPSGEDNSYGWGRINLQRAYDEIVTNLRPAVAVSVMGTRLGIKRGETAWGHVVLSSYSSRDEVITISLGLDFDGQPTGFFFIPPVRLSWPAGANNRRSPLRLALPIPADLDPKFIGKKVALRGTVRDAALQVISEARYEFTIQR